MILQDAQSRIDPFILTLHNGTELLFAMKRRLLINLLFVWIALPAVAQVEGYYRFPDIHGDQVVFSAEGDLWTVSSAGGTAVRLTTHASEESYPVFSPDGSRIAFRASYEGSPDVYVIPASGGTPERMTWDARGSVRPVDWTSQGILVRGTWTAGPYDARLALVDPDSHEVHEIPLSQAAEGAFTADGALIFARMLRQGSNSRFYKGGTSQKLWRLDLDASEAIPLTSDYPGGSRQPNVLKDGRVYFLTDRKDGMNIWSMTDHGADLVQLTRYTEFDIQELASDGQTLVFRMGADLWTITPGAEPEKLDIRLMSDIEQSLTDWETSPFSWLSDGDISNDGTTAALVSRGELFTAPVGAGRWVHVSRDSGVRYRNVVFTNDSLHVFALSDRSGELEWWKVRTDGTESPVQITRGPAMLRLDGTASPDGKYLAQLDYDDHLWLVDLTSGRSSKVAESPVLSSVAWTPDSAWLVFTQRDGNLISRLWAYNIADGTSTAVTSNRFMDSSPVVSADGNWLFFASATEWNSTVVSPWGERAPMPHFTDTERIYALPLRDGAAWPFAQPTEVKLKDEAKGDIGWHRLSAMRMLPVDAGSFQLLGATESRLLYREGADLKALDLKFDAKPVTVLESVQQAQLSGNAKQVMVMKAGKVHVISAASGAGAKIDETNQVHLDDWEFAVDKRAEWNQIYMDMWRLHRDYFWDPNMHGVDWVAMREKYAPLLPRVGSREALADLQGMLVSELSLLHSNAGGGEVRSGTNNAAPAALGGDFERDESTNGFRLTHRLEFDQDLIQFRGPLADPAADVREGSIILAVNGQSASEAPALGALLMNQAGKQVRLKLQDPDGKERTAIVTPITGGQEFNLRYHEWEYTRRLEADRLSDGEVGYVHLRAMTQTDAGQFTREFYSQLDKQGLILDVRHNNGGNIDSWVLTQLLRRPWAWFKPRAGGIAPNMQYSFGGHLVILVDERSASDGEAVADGFRRLGLGASIGMRTWGGEVWLSSSNRQVDNGITRASETGVFADGEWLIEGWGFVPDIEVDNLPHATFNGRDAQLETAVEYLLGLMEKDPRTWPEPPAYPELIPGSGFPTPWHRR